MRATRLTVALLAGATAVASVASCGTAERPRLTTPVVVGPFPPIEGLVVVEEQGVDERLARVGDDALIGSARLWRLELQGRVVGALQVSTWTSQIEDSHAERRATVDAAVHTGRTRVESAPARKVKVSARPARKGDRRPGLVRATWSTEAGFAVLTLRDDIDRAPVLAGLVQATLNPPTPRRTP